MPTAWQLNDGAQLAWRDWGDEFVVHVGAQARTHLLSAAAGRLLAALAEQPGPHSLETLFGRAFADAGEAAGMTADERRSLQAIVDEFERLGIASRVES